jgi:peptidoglycan pentaglycine glycine transferase (the first glycine)
MRVDSSTWDQFIENHPNAHILQSGRWGDLKSHFGWKHARLIDDDCGVQILFRKFPFGFTIGYVPKGPIGLSQSLIAEMDQTCKKNNSIFLKVEPFEWETGESITKRFTQDWAKTSPIQPRRTVLISLSGTEDDLLARMRQKTRYNVRLAQKKCITVHESTDFNVFYQMAEVTGKRDGFGVHSLEYYQRIMDLFGNEGKVILLFAYYDEKPIAGIIVFIQGENSWYMYGASTDAGCLTYDLWGIPDCEEDLLENQFTEKHSHDGLWGVYRFKRGFGGEVLRSVGAWDRIYQPFLYSLYQWYMKLSHRGVE